MLVLAATILLSTGCGSARKARKARKMEDARRADSIVSAQHRVDSALARADTARTSASNPDTVETASLDPNTSSVPSFILAQHGLPHAFQTFSAKSKVEYAGAGQSLDATVVIRARRDSAVWISVVAVGGAVPVARILLTPDSMLYVNFIQREGARMSAEEAVGLLPVPLEFAQVQALLFNEAQSPRASISSTGKAEVSGVYYVATRTSGTALVSYYNAGDTSLIGEDTRTVADGIQATVQYRKFEKANGKNFPLQRELKLAVPGPDSTTQHAIVLTFTDPPRFDIPLEFSFSIPKNYTLK